MWRPSQAQRPPDASAYQYNTRYNLDPAEESEETRHGSGSGGSGAIREKPQYPPPGKRPNYRPTPLKWPFIACVAAIMSILIALVVVARERMPGSDSSAEITLERRFVTEEVRILLRRQDGTPLGEGDETELDDGAIASIEAAGTPVITLSPAATAKAAPFLSTASETTETELRTELPDNLKGGLEEPGQVVLDVPMEQCGQETCTTDVTTDVITKTIVQPAELQETTITLGMTTSTSTSDVEETLVVGGTAILKESTSVFKTTTMVEEVVVVVQEVEVEVEVPIDVPTDVPTEEDDGDDECENDDDDENCGLSTDTTTESTSAEPSSGKVPHGPGSSSGLVAPFPTINVTETSSSFDGVGTGTIGLPLPIETSLDWPTSTVEEVATLISSEPFSVTFTALPNQPPPSDDDLGGGDEDDGAGGSEDDPTDGDNDQLEPLPDDPDAGLPLPGVTATKTPPRPPPPPASPAPSPKPPPQPFPPKVSFTKTKSATTFTSTRMVSSEIEVTTTYTHTTATGGFTITKHKTETEEFTLPMTTKTSVSRSETIYLELGPTTIRVTYPQPKATAGGGINDQVPITHFTTSVDPGVTVTGTVPGKPVAVVSSLPPQVQTRVLNQSPQTFVTRVGGGGITNIVVTVTPSPDVRPGVQPGIFQAVSMTVVSQVGVFRTLTVQDAPQTVVTNVNGVQTTVVRTPPPRTTNELVPGVFRTFTVQDAPQTVVTSVNGVQTTIVRTPPPRTTSELDSAAFRTFTVQDAPETVVTSINGVRTTLVTTPPPRTTSTLVSGGKLTTVAITTTPTASDLLLFTVVSTLEGTLTTITTTPSPTTIVTTIDGTLTTFTSTPSPSTYTSTVRPKSTRTIASVETPDATGSPPKGQTEVLGVTSPEYFVGKFLPALLAVLLAIVLRIIDLNAKLYQPFYALSQEGGALGSNSMLLHYSGFRGFVVPFATLFQGHPIPFITTMAVWASSLMVPLATEGLGIKIHGKCSIYKIDGCGVKLGVSPGPTHALLALMALVVMLLLVLIFFLRNWHTGLHANPWSVAGMASLAQSRDVRVRSNQKDVTRRELRDKRFAFGWFRNARGDDEYGIVLHDDDESGAGRFLNNRHGVEDSPPLDLHSESEDEFVYEVDGSGRRRIRREDEDDNGRKRHIVPFIALSYPWRIGFVLLLGCLFALILFYHLTRLVQNDFTRFMNSQSFGVRFLFAGIGVTITFAWVSFFVSVAIVTPYHLMSRKAQPAEQSILLTRPTHGVYGVYAGIKEGNVYLLIVAVMALLSEFLPLLLANIPYNLTQTERTHVVCARITLTIIGAMMLTLLASLFIRWPHMPVDPRSISGAMYYISESRMRPDFAGMSTLDQKERARRVMMLGGTYYYGDVTARGRVGVDREDVVGEVEGRMIVPGDAGGGVGSGGAGPGGPMMSTPYGTGSSADGHRGPHPSDAVSPVGSGERASRDGPAGPTNGQSAGTDHSPLLGPNTNVDTAYRGHQLSSYR